MTVDEGEAVDALKQLSLSEYEAKVFIALQKLGVGTARDVHRVTDVPRSQVYGAAENLEERGLVEVQQSKPMEYRPVSLEEARSRLEQRYEREQDRAFTYLEEAREEGAGGEEEREDFWTVQGRETINDRVVRLVEGADERVVFSSTDPDLLADRIVDVLMERSDEIDVYVVSERREVQETFRGSEMVSVLRMPEKGRRDDEGGRFVVVDDDTVLLSVLGGEELPGVKRETAIWSSDTNFASVLIQISEGWFENAFEA